MNVNALREYKQNTVKEFNRGRVTIRCILGTWTVNSLCNSTAEKAAQEMFLKHREVVCG